MAARIAPVAATTAAALYLVKVPTRTKLRDEGRQAGSASPGKTGDEERAGEDRRADSPLRSLRISREPLEIRKPAMRNSAAVENPWLTM
jgi:hypothetical protein